jgi:signal transduction histidine kinase
MAVSGFEHLVVYVLLLVVVLLQARRLYRAEVLRTYYGDLAVCAQEEERQRIGRELHDQFSQDVAAISIWQSKLIQSIHPNQVELLSQAVKQKQRIDDLANAIHTLSRDLHPYKLKLLGTEKALKACCSEFEHRHAIPVEQIVDLGSAIISAEVALCLYRVLQESLGNVQKHARAAKVKVSLSRVGRTCELTISDDGVGFVPNTQLQNRGLGIISMTERARLIGGSLTIQSKPNRGTTVTLRTAIIANPSGVLDCQRECNDCA